MDILSARKKAAERAAAKKQQKDPAPVVREPDIEASVQSGPEPPAPFPGDVPAESSPAVEACVVPEPPVEEEAIGAPRVEEIEMLSFRLGEEEYAVMVNDVKEVLKMRELTPVPNSPDYILGVTALRGPILPVIDLCKRLGIPAGTRDEKSRILVVTVDDEDAGIVVNRVTGVLRISPDAIRPAPDTLEQGGEFLRGIARKDEKLYILLDIEKALAA